jgi:hypothetical protein
MTGGPLGRDMLSFQATMEKYHAEIERLVYAAEVACNTGNRFEYCVGDCPFTLGNDSCALEYIRKQIGDPGVVEDELLLS